MIREVNHVLYLAVWPNDGHHHAAHCEFYRPADSQEDAPGALGEDESAPKANQAQPAQINRDGLWDVRLDCPITGHTARLTAPGAPIQADSGVTHVQRVTARDKFTLAQFLMWLWDATSLVRWGNGWRRDWSRVARTIRQDAQSIQVGGESFNDLLYVPPPFRLDMETEIRDGFNRFVEPLLETAANGTPRRGFILAEIKAIDKTDYGYKFMARHMARPIFMDPELHAQVAKHSPMALALLPRRKELGCAVIGLLMIEATSKGNLRAVNAALMLTNDRYLPVHSKYQLELSNHLCRDDRTFTRGAGGHVGADFVLRDTDPPTARVIYGITSPDYVRAKDSIVAQCIRSGCTIWKWDAASATQVMPTIPPRADHGT